VLWPPLTSRPALDVVADAIVVDTECGGAAAGTCRNSWLLPVLLTDCGVVLR